MAKKIFKWFGVGLGGLLGLLVLVAVVLYMIGSTKLNKKYDVNVTVVEVSSDKNELERGKHLANAVFICTECHTENFGGKEYFTVPGMVNIPIPNLTSGKGGLSNDFSIQDWVRAIRYGVGPDGKALFIMPSNKFHYISDQDLGALIAYIQSMPPVDNLLPENKVEFLGRVMIGAGMFPPFPADAIDLSYSPPASVEPGITVDYGRYLARTCEDCHGDQLNGKPFGPPGQEYLSPNLTPGGELSDWSETDFITTIRMGVTPYGKSLNQDMPWQYFGQMTDDELKAVWIYLLSLPKLEQGQ